MSTHDDRVLSRAIHVRMQLLHNNNNNNNNAILTPIPNALRKLRCRTAPYGDAMHRMRCERTFTVQELVIRVIRHPTATSCLLYQLAKLLGLCVNVVTQN